MINSGIDNSNAERIRQGKEMLDRSARRFAHVISRILYWGVEREFVPLKINPVETAREVIDSFQESFAQAKIILHPAFNEVGFVNAQPSAISALLTNLLDSHLEMCRISGKKECSIHFEIKKDNEKLFFIVSDNSGFLSEEDIQVLMKHSFASEGKEILELNYYIINHIAELHGGTFTIQISDEGKTLFSIVTIPLLK